MSCRLASKLEEAKQELEAMKEALAAKEEELGHVKRQGQADQAVWLCWLFELKSRVNRPAFRDARTRYPSLPIQKCQRTRQGKERL